MNRVRRRFLIRATAYVVAFVILRPASSVVAGEVLIYFANETAPDAVESRSYETIVEWLKSSGDERHRRTAAQLERDRRIFPAAVDVELAEIALELPRRAAGPQAVLFTNRLVRSGRCLVYKSGGKLPTETPFAVDPSDNFILNSNPCSRPETLRAALQFAAREFDPANHTFILATKSHGSREKAITPRLAVRADETNREELLRVAAENSTDENIPAWAGKLGISKAEYLSILRAAEPLKFSLAFMESCHASDGAMLDAELPPNVERLLVVRENTNYINLLWGDVFQRLPDCAGLTEAILTDLPAKFTTIPPLRGPAGPSLFRRVPLVVYFLPLMAWLGWVGYRRMSSRRIPTPPQVQNE